MHLLEFRVSSSCLGHTTVVAVSGELDVQTAERVAAKLHDAIADEASCIVVDLLETTLVDSVGIGVLAAAARRVMARGGRFVLAADDPRLLQTLRITGLDRLFNVEPNLTEAIDHVIERIPAGV